MKGCTRVTLDRSPKLSPISGDFRGMVVRAAIPNSAGLRGATSFRKPYFIAEACGDTKEDVERFIRDLYAQGYTL